MTIDINLTGLRGSVSTPGTPDYDQARSLWNGDIDKRPALIARCETAEDVSAAVRFAREHGLEIAVRGGGHSFSGASCVDDGLMIDLSRMNAVSVDPDAKAAVCGGGAPLSALDAATQAHGLAVPAGTISHTGVAGLTLGGGFGWLTNRHGLSCDNLIGADMVLADGRQVHASETEHPDLFWAIRGGGGNFGVVTDFRFRLHEVGPLVNLGMFFFGLDRGGDALRLAREIDLPRDAGMMVAGLNAPPAPFVPEQHHFAPGFAVLLIGFGSPEEHARMIEPAQAAAPLFQFVTPMPYTALQSMLDDSAPWGVYAYEKALYVKEFSDDVIDVITAQMARKSSPMSIVPMFQLSGAYCDVPEDATAFGGTRTSKWVVNTAALASERGLFETDRAWTRDFYEALLPHAAGNGVYVNFLNEYDADRVRAAYGPKYDRLARIKAEYDPDNTFHRNVNISPA